MDEFKKGDVVKLKSSDVLMTISKIVIGVRTNKQNGIIICQWFDGNALKEAEFNVDSLVKN